MISSHLVQVVNIILLCVISYMFQDYIDNSILIKGIKKTVVLINAIHIIAI